VRARGTARGRGADLTAYIRTAVAGFVVGLLAWLMSHPDRYSVPPVVSTTVSSTSAAPTNGVAAP
jgi:hypothetical protein